MGTGTSFSSGRAESGLSSTRQSVLTVPLTVADRNTGNGAVEQHRHNNTRPYREGNFLLTTEGGRSNETQENVVMNTETWRRFDEQQISSSRNTANTRNTGPNSLVSTNTRCNHNSASSANIFTTPTNQMSIDLPQDGRPTLNSSDRCPEPQHGLSLSSREETRVTSLEHTELVKEAFKMLAKEYSVYFDTDQIVSSAVVFRVETSSVVITAACEPSGTYIVLEGVFSCCSPEDGLVLGHLYSGEMFGEVATLMNIPNNMTVKCESRGSLIRVPVEAVSVSVTGKILKTKCRSWCVKRAHIYTSGLFDHNTLILLITASALKSTKQFRDWSYESLEYMSRLCQMTLFNKGEALSKIGEPSSHTYIIINGRLELTTQDSSTLLTVRTTDESCCVGHEELFKKTQRKETVIALSPVLAAPLGREAIVATLEEFPNERELFKAHVNS